MKKLIFIFTALFLFANDCVNKTFTYSNSDNINDRMSIKEFLSILATQKCHINIVYEDEKAKTILSQKMPFVRMKNYTLTDIFDYLISNRGLFYSLDNSTLDISYYKTKTYKLDFLSSSRIGESNLDATDSKVKNEYSFDFWDKIENNIKTILTNISSDSKPPIIDRSVGLITITGNKRQIEAIDKYIDTLKDRLGKEVLIDVKIYSVELSNSHQTGIDWSKFSLSVNSNSNLITNGQAIAANTLTLSNLNLQGLLNFLARNGNVNSISNPKIATLNNQKAIISVGDTIYYKYQSSATIDKNGNVIPQYKIDSKFVGVVLDITPQISDNGEIILSISPQISTFKDPNQLNNINRDMPPDTSSNTMISVVKLKDNQTLVLGGLITKNNSFSSNGVPVLKEIPIVKYLFSSKDEISSKRELVFVITPHIIDLNKKKTLRDLGFGEF